MSAMGALFPVLDAGVELVTPAKSTTLELSLVKHWYREVGELIGTNYIVTAGIALVVVSIFPFLFKTAYLYFSQKVLAYLWVLHQQRNYSVLSRAEYTFYMEEDQGKVI